MPDWSRRGTLPQATGDGVLVVAIGILCGQLASTVKQYPELPRTTGGLEDKVLGRSSRLLDWGFDS
jgi:hypothetical protein